VKKDKRRKGSSEGRHYSSPIPTTLHLRGILSPSQKGGFHTLLQINILTRRGSCRKTMEEVGLPLQLIFKLFFPEKTK
jgi:hypothetical protein